MYEIKMKFKLEDKQDMINRLLIEKCTFSEEKIVETVTFLPENIIDFKVMKDTKIIRIKKLDDSYIVTMKKLGGVIDFNIQDYKNFELFLLELGYKKIVTVRECKIETTFNGFDICINDVLKAGAFIEIKLKTNSRDDYYKEKILNVAKELDIEPSTYIAKSYDVLVHEVNNWKIF